MKQVSGIEQILKFFSAARLKNAMFSFLSRCIFLVVEPIVKT